MSHAKARRDIEEVAAIVVDADDHFLASAIDIMRADLTTHAFIVTSDINLQNKAEMAGLPFREVPASIAKQGEQ